MGFFGHGVVPCEVVNAFSQIFTSCLGLTFKLSIRTIGKEVSAIFCSINDKTSASVALIVD